MPRAPRTMFCLAALVASAAFYGLGRTHSAQAQTTAGLTPYTFGNPSNDETAILELINRARANPAAEGQRLVDDLNANYPAGNSGDDLNQLLADFRGYPVRPPLAFNAELNAAAQYHLPEMVAMGGETHYSPNGDGAGTRVQKFDYPFFGGENTAGDPNYPVSVLAYQTEYLYEVDAGVSDLGHRLTVMEPNALSITSAPEVEIGVAQRALGGWNVEDFGDDLTPTLLTGVVFTDNAATGFYAPGESVGGVTVTAPGASSFYAVTVASGAYTLPLDLLTFNVGVKPNVQVVFTDAAGKLTTQTVTLGHTVGTDGVSTYHDASGNVRYDNAKVDLVEAAAVTPTPTPNPMPTPNPTPTMPQVTVAPTTSGQGFILTRMGDASTTLLVTYVVKGTAVAGQDYAPLKGTKKIKAGKSSVNVNVQPLPGGAGTVKLKVVDAGTYSVAVPGQAKVKLGPSN